MNTLTKVTAPLTYVLRLRFLISLLVLGYLVMGGFFVPSASVAAGHLIMGVLAISGLSVLIFGFYRYDTAYRNPSIHRALFASVVWLGIGFVCIIVIHLHQFVTNGADQGWVYYGEVAVGLLALLAFLIIGKEYHRSWI